MNEEHKELLYRSFDALLSDAEQQELERALAASEELRAEKEALVAMRAALSDSAADGCSTCSTGCDSNRGGCHDGYCQPYTTPQLPSSTFYQYWRSNACNVNVWYGFKNHCHGANRHTMGQCDCFEKKKGLCGRGCASACQIVEPVHCGPAPNEWCDTFIVDHHWSAEMVMLVSWKNTAIFVSVRRPSTDWRRCRAVRDV